MFRSHSRYAQRQNILSDHHPSIREVSDIKKSYGTLYTGIIPHQSKLTAFASQNYSETTATLTYLPQGLKTVNVEFVCKINTHTEPPPPHLLNKIRTHLNSYRGLLDAPNEVANLTTNRTKVLDHFVARCCVVGSRWGTSMQRCLVWVFIAAYTSASLAGSGPRYDPGNV